MRNSSKKIKICHVVSKLDVGGMENGVVNLLKNHDRSRFELMLCCLNEPGLMAPRLMSDVQLVCIGMPEGKRQLLYMPELVSTFSKTSPDVVHVHGWAGGSLYGVLGARLAGVPVVVNGEHGGFKTRNYQVILQRLLAMLCDRTLSVGKELKDEVVRRLGIHSECITVIPNGVDVEVFSGHYQVDKTQLLKRFRPDLGNDVKPFIIGCIGSIKPSKNQIMILKAMKRLREKIPGYPLYVMFVGDGPDRPMLENFVRNSNLDEQVVFVGIRHDVPQLLSAMDVLVSLSLPNRDGLSHLLTEGLSNVLLEAMSSGVPAIATDSIGASELMIDGFNGFIVKCHDDEALCNRIEMLIHDPDLCIEISCNAKRFINEHYSLQRMVARYESLYIECLSDRKLGNSYSG